MIDHNLRNKIEKQFMKEFNKPVGILELLSGQVVPPGGHFVDSLLEPQAALWGKARTIPGIPSLGPVG